MSSEVKGLVPASVVATATDGSGEESSSSTYGTVQDSIVMCSVPSDSSDTEAAADDPNRRLVHRAADTTVSDVSSARTAT